MDVHCNKTLGVLQSFPWDASVGENLKRVGKRARLSQISIYSTMPVGRVAQCLFGADTYPSYFGNIWLIIVTSFFWRARSPAPWSHSPSRSFWETSCRP